MPTAQRAAVSLLAVLVGTMTLARARQDQIFSKLEAVYPHSLPTEVVSDREGKYVYVSQGGALAIYQVQPDHTWAEDKPPVQIGSEGVKPVRMLVDPGATLENGQQDPEDLIYIAGGRSGLWVMDARPDAGVENFAARVDDSGNLLVTKQTGRRWCCDVEIVDVGGTKYLAALFGKRNRNRLRLYALDDVRAVFANAQAAGSSTGWEISAALQVKIDKHPDASPGSHSFASGMATDAVDPAGSAATFYIALGEQGLARVVVSSIPASPKPPVEWGPVFGDGTHYNEPSTPAPPGFDRHDYGDFEYWRDFGTSEALLLRSDPPQFIDVAFHQDASGGRFVYTTVEHLNWLRFDVTNASDWGHEMPIDHHEGYPRDAASPQFQPSSSLSHPWAETHVAILENGHPEFPATQNFTYARRMAICEDTDAGPVLLVTATRIPFQRRPDFVNEGFVFGHRWTWVNGVDFKEYSQVQGSWKMTVYYRLEPTAGVGFSPGYNAAGIIEAGGDMLSVPCEQTIEDTLVFFGGTGVIDSMTNETGLEVEIVSIHADLNTGTCSTKQLLDRDDWPGRRNFGVLPSVADPNVFLSCVNDGPIDMNGILVSCTGANGEPEFLTHYDDTLQPDDQRSTIGVQPKKRCQWGIDPSVPGQEKYFYYLGAGAGSPSGAAWMFVRFFAGEDPNAFNGPPNDPDEVRRWFVIPPPDRFQSVGRAAHWGGETLPGHDPPPQTTAGPVIFANRFKSPTGIVMLHRDEIENQFDPGNDGQNMAPLNDEQKTSDVDPIFRALNTHPELDWVDTQGASDDWMDFLNNFGTEGHFHTHPPTLVPVRGNGGTDADNWALAVPCGFVYTDIPVFEPSGAHPEWAPPPSSQYFGKSDHLMVQFWDVTDPENIPVTGPEPGTPNADVTVTTNSPLPKIIEGTFGGHAWKIESLVLDEAVDRSFCFISDFAGKVIVYEITDLLQTNASIDRYAEYVPMKSVSDSLRNNVWDIAIDDLASNGEIYVYVAVARVGVEVLRFNPASGTPFWDRLEHVKLIQTPGDVKSLVIRDAALPGDRVLVLSDGEAGIRMYGYEDL